MTRLQPFVALLCAFLLLAPAAGAADDRIQTPVLAPHGGFLARLTNPYTPRAVPPARLGNSGRLDKLLRAGKLFLSLDDAIALALENNLDIEIQRYGPQVADTAILSARAGGFARGVSTSITAGATSAAPASTAQQVGAGSSAQQQASAATSTAVSSGVITQTGSSIPSLDPAFTASGRWAHLTSPQTSAFTTGTNALITRNDTSSYGLQQGFLSGTIVNLALTNSATTNNNRRADFNPATSSTLGLTVTQHLLQGFGLSVNSRQIVIAKNNREISDLTFKLQVITTVSSVVNLYWDLVSFNQDVRVKREALASSQKLYNDNRQQVEVGTLAPIEIVRAEAEVASREQDLTISETQILQQEAILKNSLSRNGIASPAVADARIVPTDRFTLPAVEPIEPMQDLVASALASRTELAQSRIQVSNQVTSLKGSRSALLPSVDLVATLNNNALAGQPNALPALPGSTHNQNPFLVGGYGTVLSQIMARNFPDYAVGVNVNIPLRNRAAQAQIISDELALRQQQLGLQRLENQVRVDVLNAVVAVRQARARYQAAQKARTLQEQTLDAEQKKYALGASTIYSVILAQRDLITSQSSEVAAMGVYSRARVDLDRSTGQTLVRSNISLREAYDGVVARPPSALPAER
jgi:outer membrane protein TolC